ncbi:MAG TPA: GHKL domain-containing protein [Bacilli bacterium]|nr:GHKL domain-containing protein [Bacilli bacterium]
MILEIIIGFFVVILSLMIFILSYKKLTKQSLNINIKKIILIMVIAILIMANNIFNVNVFKVVTTVILMFAMVKFWFKDNNKKTFYYIIIISLTSMIVELLLNKLLAVSFTNLNELNNSLMARSAITMIFSVMTYFVFLIKPINTIIIKLEQIMTKRRAMEVYLIIIVFIVNLLLMQMTVNYRNAPLYFASITIIIMIFSILLAYIKDRQNKETLEIRNKYLNDNVKHYELISDDYSELKHNLNHDFMAIRSVANQEAQELIDEIMQKYNKNYSWTTKIGKIPKGIQGLFCIKIYEGKKENIDIEVKSKVEDNINEQIKMRTYSKLCDTIGITVDNAITAAKRSKEKAIYIDMAKKDNILEIKIMNTFKDMLDLEQLGTFKYSTKEKKSGIGLSYLNKILKKDIEIKKEIINNIFIVSLCVPLK